MAWKCYALGVSSVGSAASAAATIISEQFGVSCSTSNGAFRYKYNGVSYIVGYKYGGSTDVNFVLCLNAETGEFVLAPSVDSYEGTNASYFISSAILRVETADGVAMSYMTFPDFPLSTLFNITGDNSTYINTTNRITLYPAVVGPKYPYTLDAGKQMYCPFVDMFASNTNSVIKAGQTIEVDGQQFLCVSCGLFAKL